MKSLENAPLDIFTDDEIEILKKDDFEINDGKNEAKF